jgi:hypothetical protein
MEIYAGKQQRFQRDLPRNNRLHISQPLSEEINRSLIDLRWKTSGRVQEHSDISKVLIIEVIFPYVMEKHKQMYV